MATPSSATVLYDAADLAGLPDDAVLASLGCGNPTAVAELSAGETVLDLGSGGGIDVLLSAKRVGPTGFAYGLDMTDEMLELAGRNAAEAGVINVEFRKGRIEAIPLPDASVDVVISNCVINLSADKGAVFAEIARVLRPGWPRWASAMSSPRITSPRRASDPGQPRRLHRGRTVVRGVPGRARRRRPGVRGSRPDPPRRGRPALSDRACREAGRLDAGAHSGRGPAATGRGPPGRCGRGLLRRDGLLLTLGRR